MEKTSKIILIFVLALALSGCSLRQAAVDDDSWKDEVLLAQDCGLDGLQCCTDREPACSFGQQCCADPNNADNNYCSDDCSCGGQGKFCCAGEKQCGEGLACSDGLCQECGGKGQPCCSSDQCGGDLVCFQGGCVECGLPGNPCCGGTACENSDKFDNDRTECRNGVCVYCGSGGKISCSNSSPCNPGMLLNNDFCLECGEYNQPCCNLSANKGYVCNPAGGLSCQLGFCAK